MAKNLGHIPHEVSVFHIAESDHGIKLLGEATDTSEPAELTINFKGYDSDTRKWVDDEEVYAAAEERVKSLGATSVETAYEDLTALVMAESLILPEVYILEDRAQWTPINDFSGNRTKWTVIDANVAKKLKAYKGEDLQTLPIEEFHGYRFNVGVNVDGMNIRISQFAFADEDGDIDDEIPSVSIKYTTKRIDGYREDLKEGKVADQMVESVKRTVDRLVANQRKAKVEELSELFGRDFEGMIENGDTFVGKVITQKFGKDNYYAIMVLSPNGIDVIDGEVKVDGE